MFCEVSPSYYVAAPWWMPGVATALLPAAWKIIKAHLLPGPCLTSFPVSIHPTIIDPPAIDHQDFHHPQSPHLTEQRSTMSSVTPAKPSLLYAAAAFIERPSTSARRRAQFAAVVEDIPIYKTTDNYSTDIERRIEAIRKIQKDILTRYPDKLFNPIQVAYLMQLDLGSLEEMLDSVGHVATNFHRVARVEPFVRACKPRDPPHSPLRLLPLTCCI